MHANSAFLLAVPLLTGCGAMMAPGPFLVPVDSEPSGATVVYQGKAVGVTPCVVPMQRASRAFELRREGCHPRIAEVGTEANR
ncbi:MAG TPA: PEGA domain-containing protein [Planctomycetota bacterium]|nr:PEGA domain-containing protein [Planctomycetota bacterium]